MDRAGRYEALTAMLIGISAILISAYTAWIQRQQVRAQVWPRLEGQFSNVPDLHWDLVNSGVGPAIVRDVVVTLDGKPVPSWERLVTEMFGPKKVRVTYSSMHNRVLGPGAVEHAFAPSDDKGEPLRSLPEGGLGAQLQERLHRVGISVCYCSTLDECWMFESPPDGEDVTTPIARCPAPSARSFRE